MLLTCDHTGSRLSNVDEQDHLYGVHGGSGSYADTIFRYAARVLFDKDMSGRLEYKTLRNADFKEVSLEVGTTLCCETLMGFGCMVFHGSAAQCRLCLKNKNVVPFDG